MLGKHLVQHWTRMQPVVSQSSAEAELVAAAKAVSEMAAVTHLMVDLGLQTKLQLRVDARACRAMLLRKGAGRVKHLSIRYLWVQRAVREYAIHVEHVPRKHQLADVLTHAVTWGEMAAALTALGCRRH